MWASHCMKRLKTLNYLLSECAFTCVPPMTCVWIAGNSFLPGQGCNVARKYFNYGVDDEVTFLLLM